MNDDLLAQLGWCVLPGAGLGRGCQLCVSGDTGHSGQQCAPTSPLAHTAPTETTDPVKGDGSSSLLLLVFLL